MFTVQHLPKIPVSWISRNLESRIRWGNNGAGCQCGLQDESEQVLERPWLLCPLVLSNSQAWPEETTALSDGLAESLTVEADLFLVL